MMKYNCKELPKTMPKITTGGSKPTGIPRPVASQIKSSIGVQGGIPRPVSRTYKSHVM